MKRKDYLRHMEINPVESTSSQFFSYDEVRYQIRIY